MGCLSGAASALGFGAKSAQVSPAGPQGFMAQIRYGLWR